MPPPDQFQFTEAQRDDFESVAALFGALHTYNATLDPSFALADNWRALLHDYFVRTFDDPQTFWLLAWKDARPVGLLIVKGHIDSPLFRHRHWTELVAIYVEPECRGTSLARTLVERARDWTMDHGSDRMQLYVTATNATARAFYRSCGLRPIQEIWRLDIPNSCELVDEADQDADTDFLEAGHHPYLGGE